MKKTLIIILSPLFTTASFAAGSSSFSKAGLNLTVEPIVGFETTHRDAPTPHSKMMLNYGVRIIAGHPLISGEAEATRGTDSEAFENPSQVVKTEKENVKLGVRSTHTLIPGISASIRFGGQASRTKVETIQLNNSTTENGKWDISPYAGAGLQGSLGGQFSISAEVVYVFNSVEDFSKNNLQTTLGIKLNL